MDGYRNGYNGVALKASVSSLLLRVRILLHPPKKLLEVFIYGKDK
jgi:hypothetical protein